MAYVTGLHINLYLIISNDRRLFYTRISKKQFSFLMFFKSSIGGKRDLKIIFKFEFAVLSDYYFVSTNLRTRRVIENEK